MVERPECAADCDWGWDGTTTAPGDWLECRTGDWGARTNSDGGSSLSRRWTAHWRARRLYASFWTDQGSAGDLVRRCAYQHQPSARGGACTFRRLSHHHGDQYCRRAQSY